MRASKKFITHTVILLFILYLTGVSFAAEEQKEEMKLVNKIVTISTYEGITPITISSVPGTTVIWVNHSKHPVELLFTDKKVVLACSSPVNFFIGKEGAYESAKIPFAGTASLCFTEKGRYEYMVRSSTTFYPGKREHRGGIVIE
jgi:plastocyanin